MPLDGWQEKLFRRYLLWNCRPARVKGYLNKSLPAARPLPPQKEKRVKVAALQLQVKLFKDPLAYVEEMHRRVREAAEVGAHLAVFPEDNNLQLLGMLPGIEEMGKAAEGEGGAGSAPAGPSITVGDVIRFVTPAFKPLIHATFATLSAAYGLYLMAGSFLLYDGDRLVNRAILYGPDGGVVGSQDKVHLMPVEDEWGVTRGDNFTVFDTAIGRVAMPVCMDATYYETFRILESRNADIVMIPIANPEPYNHWLALRGLWPRVQESPVYGIKSALVGSIPGFEFTGRAGIFAPMELTSDGRGVLAEVEHPDREGMAVAELDLDALRQLRTHHPWRDSNPDLYRRYFPAVYCSKLSGENGE